MLHVANGEEGFGHNEVGLPWSVSEEAQEGGVGRESLREAADWGLVVGARSGLELGEAPLADGVPAREADRDDGGEVVPIGAHRALKELCPRRSLHCK